MSALTLRKKRNLGKCITNSTINPPTHRFILNTISEEKDKNWRVEEFAKEHMENGIQVAKIDQKELILKLQVFDSTSSVEEIKRLLEKNQSDFVSVMNILKEKHKLRQRQKIRRTPLLRGNLLKQKIFQKLRVKKKKTVEENVVITEEKPSPRIQVPIESKVNKEEMANRILMCKSKEDVQQVVNEIAQNYDNTVKKLKISQVENHILKMGICQRKKITQKEIKKRVEVQAELEDTKMEVQRLVQSQNQLQQSLNGNWMMNHFGRENF